MSDVITASRQFSFNWKVSLFSLFFGVVFINLGFWQLSRAEEKRGLMAAQARVATLPPVDAERWIDDETLNGRAIRLKGHYVQDKVWLLDNVVLDGKVGFEVIQLFDDPAAALSFYVNRGFAPMGRTRQDLPVVTAPPGEVEVIASAYQPAGEAFRLQGADRVDRDIIQGIADLPVSDGVHPVTLRIDEGAPGALPRYWPATNMTPEKHTGYAVQWFTMAFAVTVAWLFFSFPKRELEG